MAKAHPARQRLEALSPGLRWLADLIDQTRASHASEWPASIYCPSSALMPGLPDAVMRVGGREMLQQMAALGPLRLTQMLDPLMTLATWRMTQGIYRIDPAVYPAIVDTPLAGDIPVQMLQRLPEWCLYIETPGLSTPSPEGGSVDIVGAWVRTDASSTGVSTLVIAPCVPGDLAMAHQHIPLHGSIEDSVRSVLQDWQASAHAAPIAHDPDALPAIIGYTTAIINLTLYIVSSGDLSRQGQPAQPANPAPKRTRRDGLRLYPATGPAQWDVGVRMGAALRAAYHAAEAGGDTHSGPRGHVRRAHWHGFWSGPLKREDGSAVPQHQRRYDLRWMPPIPVNLPDAGTLPATIRRVP